MSGSWSICRRLTESRCINFRFAQSGGAISSLGLVVLLTVQFLVSRLVRHARPLWDLEVGLVGGSWIASRDGESSDSRDRGSAQVVVGID